MNVNMKSEISLKTLLNPKVDFAIDPIPFRLLTEIRYLDEICLASPMEIHRFQHLLEKGVENALPGAVLIMVPDDMRRLELDPVSIAKKLKNANVACVFVTEGEPVPEKWIMEFQRVGLPLIHVEMNDKMLTDTLYDVFHLLTVETKTVHGNMMDLFGIGILILGRSGIGKSECCLDLIMKGHRLISDDSTLLYKSRQGGLTATASKRFAGGWMEIRGVGIIDVDLLFGIAALRKRKDLHLVVELMDWDQWEEEIKEMGTGRLPSRDLDRFLAREPGNPQDKPGTNLLKSYLGIDIPLAKIPVGPGRSIANLIEVAARKKMLEISSPHARPGFFAGNERES